MQTLTILRAAALSDPSTPLPELAHAALTRLLENSPDANPLLILGTTLGCLETDREFDRSRLPTPRYASPAAFAKTLPSTIPAQLALTFHLTAPSLVLSAGSASAATALRRAATWLHHLNLTHAIAGGLDYITENPTTPPTCQIALLLLTTSPTTPNLGQLTLHPHSPPDLTAHHDTSLDLLLQWIQTPATTNLGAGVTLTR